MCLGCAEIGLICMNFFVVFCLLMLFWKCCWIAFIARKHLFFIFFYSCRENHCLLKLIIDKFVKNHWCTVFLYIFYPAVKIQFELKYVKFIKFMLGILFENSYFAFNQLQVTWGQLLFCFLFSKLRELKFSFGQ